MTERIGPSGVIRNIEELPLGMQPWRDLLSDPLSTTVLVAEVAGMREGLSVAIIEQELDGTKRITVLGSRQTVDFLNAATEQGEIGSLLHAELGSDGKPEVDFPSWDFELRAKVIAFWWEKGRKSRKHAEKVLAGREPLSVEDRKRIIGRRIDELLQETNKS